MNRFAYVGCRTTKERGARGKGISVYRVTENGWEPVQILEGMVNPSYLCPDRQGKTLYAVHGDFCQVSACRIAGDGSLTYLNTVGTHGTNPVHLSLDRTGKWLFVANLQTGGVAVIPVREDGSLGRIKELEFISGNGGPGYISHPHQVAQDRAGQWLLVPSQGRLQGVGKITVFRIDSEAGTITEVSHVRSRSGAEPRHCVFHPNNRFCYGVNEKDSTAEFYEFDAQNGILRPRQIVSVLPEDYAGDGWASAIDMDPSGRCLYISNRRHDSITVLSLEQESGKMQVVQNIRTCGEQPRFITVDPDGRQLLAANELSDSIQCFDIDEADGTLKENGTVIGTESPVCVVFIDR